MAFYEQKDWEYFLSIVDDKENLHEKWEDWFKAYSKLKAHLVSEGLVVRDVKVNINELMDYCLDRKIKIDGKARSMFVQTK
jgi:hypothetical protein